MSQFYAPKGDFESLDRTVHAITKDGWHVVRYDRASKWYLEHPGKDLRVHISLATAVDHATEKGSVFFSDRPGGKSFDARVREAVKERKGE